MAAVPGVRDADPVRLAVPGVVDLAAGLDVVDRVGRCWSHFGNLDPLTLTPATRDNSFTV